MAIAKFLDCTTNTKVVLKLGGEAFSGENSIGFDIDAIKYIAEELYEPVIRFVRKISIVVGGNNVVDTEKLAIEGVTGVTADNMGMLGTVLNAVLLQDILEENKMDTRVISAIDIRELAEPFIVRRARRHIAKERIVIFAAGTGNPHFSTDMAAVIRANEIGAGAILKGTDVEGLCDGDAIGGGIYTKPIEKITFDEVIERRFSLMDLSAVVQARELNIPIIIYNFFEKGNTLKILRGEEFKGTIISNAQS